MQKPGSNTRHYFQFNIILLALFVILAYSGCNSTSQSPNATPTTSFTPTSTLETPVSPTSSSTPGSSPTTSPSPTTTSSPGSVTDMVTKYYQALEKQNYNLAYSFLDPNATTTTGQRLTLEVFKGMAQTSDSTEGQITTFSIGTYTPLIVMTITRRNGPYHAHLQVKLEGSSWKITSLDLI